jgi:hypothetical protein
MYNISSKQDNAVSQWAFNINSTPTTTENWHLKGHMQHVKVHAVPLQHHKFCYKYEYIISYWSVYFK